MRPEAEMGQLYIKRRHKSLLKVEGSLGLLRVVATNTGPFRDPKPRPVVEFRLRFLYRPPSTWTQASVPYFKVTVSCETIQLLRGENVTRRNIETWEKMCALDARKPALLRGVSFIDCQASVCFKKAGRCTEPSVKPSSRFSSSWTSVLGS